MMDFLKMESPFTWDVKDADISSWQPTPALEVAYEDEPFLCLMNKTTKLFCLTRKHKYSKARRQLVDLITCLQKHDTDWSKEGLSFKALSHVIWATVYNACTMWEDHDAHKALLRIPVGLENPIDKATILGCKSTMTSNFASPDPSVASSLALQAVQIYPCCPVWHYLLYGNIRRSRLLSIQNSSPWDLEKEAILNCTNLETKPIYMLCEAQMYMDSGNTRRARYVYEEIYDKKPKSNEILLRLGGGLLSSSWNLDRAIDCFEKINKEEVSKDPSFVKFKTEITKRKEEMLKYFLEMADVAEKMNQKMNLSLKRKAFNHIFALKAMLEIYQSIDYKQHILIQLGIQYRIYDDYIKSCESFLQAIKLNQNCDILDSCQNLLSAKNETVKVNVFEYLKHLILVWRKRLQKKKPELLSDLEHVVAQAEKNMRS